MLPEAQYMRIAIAISALKFRPPNQSYSSYALDLRVKFPDSSTESHSQDEESLWRSHALSVERDLVELQARYDRDHIKLLSLLAAVAPTANEPDVPVVHSSNKRAKKKRALQTLARSGRVDLDTILSGQTDYLGMSASPRQETLFSAFYALTDLEDAHERKPMPIALLTATANRAMETLGAVIQSMLPPYLSTRSPTKTLHMISTMLSYLLSVILPLLIVDPKVDGRLTVQDLAVDADQFLRRFATVYTSIIRSFEPVSRSTLWSVFSIQGNSKNDVPLSGNDPLSVDELLALLRRAVSILDQVHSHTGCKLIDGLKDHLGLEALRELEKASLRPNRDGRPCSQVRCLPEERVSLLVNKDIIWYMCNILHLMFTPTLAHSEFARHFPFVQDDLLKNGIMGIISGIILHSRLYVKAGSITSNGILNQGRPLLDEVGHGMAIAVAEKVWLRWFGVGGQTSLRPDS